MIRYGKPNADYLRVKGFYFNAEDNARLAAKAAEASAFYATQPPRPGCVICKAPIGVADFHHLGAGYAVCPQCGHLNGLNDDTAEFARFLYEEGHIDTTAYQDPSMENFLDRVLTVYRPKADFLAEALRQRGEDPAALRFADLGAGAGHFVIGLQQAGMDKAVGYETDADLVAGSNRRFNREILRHNRIEDLNSLAAGVEAEVVTMIFALEHIRDLDGFMTALRSNPHVRHFFFSVPMFGPSALLDVAFPQLGPRTLGLGHTHLFSDKSLDVLCRRFGLKRTAEWWFGGNAFDVIRNVAVNLRANPGTQGAADLWFNQMIEVVDEVQLAFDHRKLSSEIHLLTEVER